jgi:heterokaryon incompatibility protein (HET)
MDWLNTFGDNLSRQIEWLFAERPRYQYEPLPHGRWFRLLRLLPGQPSDPIECELVMYEFKTAPSYEPISYRLGDATLSEEIVCDGKGLSITHSLLTALHRLRYTNQIRLVWADGICINQKDRNEQGYRVDFMPEIYAGGCCTLIWMGEEIKHPGCVPKGYRYDCAEVALNIMKRFNTYVLEQLGDIDPSDTRSIWDRLHKIQPVPPNHELYTNPERWKCVETFFRRGWLKRIWALQEVGFSRRARAYCGRMETEFSEITLFAILFSHLEYIVKVDLYIYTRWVRNPFFALWGSLDLRESWIESTPLLQALTKWGQEITPKDRISHVIQVLELGRAYSAPDPRDHVYALLGQPVVSELFKDDFGPRSMFFEQITAEELCWHIALRLCLAPESLPGSQLNFLGSVENNEKDLHATFPSWIPKWHKKYDFMKKPRLKPLSSEMVEEVVIYFSYADKSRLHVAALMPDSFSISYASGKLTDHGFTTNTENAIEHLWHRLSENMTAEQSQSVEIWMRFSFALINGQYRGAENFLADFLEFCRQYCSSDFHQRAHDVLSCDHPEHQLEGLDASSERFKSHIMDQCLNQKFFITRNGMLGIGPELLQGGDIVAYPFGCQFPLILRSYGLPSQYRIVGNCDVYDLLEDINECLALKGFRDGSIQKREIVLV